MENYLEKISSDISEIKDAIIIFAIMLFVIFLAKSAYPDDRVTVYSRSCNQQNVSAQDCKSWNLGGKETYYINKYTQEVMFDGTYGPVSYAGCHVVDNENWYCDFGKGALGLNDFIGYRNGQMMEDTFSSRMFAAQHFGFFKYWWYKLLGWV